MHRRLDVLTVQCAAVCFLEIRIRSSDTDGGTGGCAHMMAGLECLPACLKPDAFAGPNDQDVRHATTSFQFQRGINMFVGTGF
jgi:hypothetical protein